MATVPVANYPGKFQVLFDGHPLSCFNDVSPPQTFTYDTDLAKIFPKTTRQTVREPEYAQLTKLGHLIQVDGVCATLEAA